VDRSSKYHTKASHLVRPHQHFCLNTNTRIGHLRNNSRTFINRLHFLWFLNLVFLLCFLFFVLFLFLFLYYQLHHHYSIIHILTLFILPRSPSQLHFLLILYSFNCLHLILPSSSNPSLYYPCLLHTHHMLISLPYQLHTTPAPCNLWHKHPLLQQ
jgi:hypothetical protein